jgi:hypothetical protein
VEHLRAAVHDSHLLGASHGHDYHHDWSALTTDRLGRDDRITKTAAESNFHTQESETALTQHD